MAQNSRPFDQINLSWLVGKWLNVCVECTGHQHRFFGTFRVISAQKGATGQKVAKMARLIRLQQPCYFIFFAHLFVNLDFF